MNQDMLNTVRDISSACRTVSDEVGDVALLLDAVGLGKLADRLWSAIDGLPSVAERLQSEFSRDLHVQIEHNEQMTGKLFLLALQRASQA